MQYTLSIIKPDAVRRNVSGDIIAMIQHADLQVCGIKMLHLSPKQAEGFYAVHKGKPFFSRLIEYMSSGPIICMVLAKDDAITAYRALMGNTNPEEAAEGTIRQKFALNKTENSVHGSDAPETAASEIAYFFTSLEIQTL